MVRARMFAMLAAVTLAGVFVATIPSAPAGAAPSAAPSPRFDSGMAYDATHGQVVLFGGYEGHFPDLADTWTWDGTAWTEQHPADSPVPRYGMGMVYDAATGEVVLFGGYGTKQGGGYRDQGDTWTWDGVTWTKRHPATSPSARDGLGMAYDATRGQVVLFGGRYGDGYKRADTWTWDGVTWTKRHPATSPSGREAMGMAYDAARGRVVLFGGDGGSVLGDTWTWDGVTWTQEHPATSPRPRFGMGMAFDAARGEVLLFGGGLGYPKGNLNDAWAWDGTTWTQEHPVTSPSVRYRMAMTYDTARSEALLFGGYRTHEPHPLGDTWTWNGQTWHVPFDTRLNLDPKSGPPGTSVRVTGSGFSAFENVTLTFIDSVNGQTALGAFKTDASGNLAYRVTVPANATIGPQKVTAAGVVSGQKAKVTFTVT